MANAVAPTATNRAQTPTPDPPQWVTNLLKYLLRTPLHGVFSKSIMLLVFHGRKTGQVYSTPVSYLREGNIVIAFTDSPWQRNLRGGAPVTMYLKGKAVSGCAEIVDDSQAVAEGLAHYLSRARGDAKFYGVSFDTDGQPNREQVARVAQHHVMLQIQIAPVQPRATRLQA